MSVRLYIVQGQTVYQLPVNPPEIGIKTPSDNTTVNLVKLGEVNVLRNPKLTEIDFDSFFPVDLNAPHVENWNSLQPEQYVNLFNSIKHSKEPIQFVIQGYFADGIPFNEFMSVEDFDHKLTAHGDVDYKLRLKIYQPYSAKVLDAQGKVVSEGRVMTKVIPKTLVCKAGDSLLSVGKKVLGHGAAFQAIAKLNNIFDAGKKLAKGVVLKIPYAGQLASGLNKSLNFVGINTKALTLGQVANMASGGFQFQPLAKLRVQSLQSRARFNFRNIPISRLNKLKLPASILNGM